MLTTDSVKAVRLCWRVTFTRLAKPIPMHHSPPGVRLECSSPHLRRSLAHAPDAPPEGLPRAPIASRTFAAAANPPPVLPAAYAGGGVSVPPPRCRATPFLGGVAGADAGDITSRFFRVNPAFANQKLPFPAEGCAGRGRAGRGRAGRGRFPGLLLLPPGLGRSGSGGGVPSVPRGGGGGGLDGTGGSMLLPDEFPSWLTSAFAYVRQN